MNDDEDSVAFYPWRTTSGGALIKSSVSGEIDDMLGYIRDEYNKSPRSLRLTSSPRKKSFFFLYWIVHLCGGQSPSVLYEIYQSIYPDSKEADIRNKLFCLELLGWIGRIRYGTKEYFFAIHDDDPFQYRFRVGVTKSNATARKQEAFEWIEGRYPVDRRARRRILQKRRELAT
jgi:hypothetical protein